MYISAHSGLYNFVSFGIKSERERNAEKLVREQAAQRRAAEKAVQDARARLRAFKDRKNPLLRTDGTEVDGK